MYEPDAVCTAPGLSFAPILGAIVPCAFLSRANRFRFMLVPRISLVSIFVPHINVTFPLHHATANWQIFVCVRRVRRASTSLRVHHIPYAAVRIARANSPDPSLLLSLSHFPFILCTMAAALLLLPNGTHSISSTWCNNQISVQPYSPSGAHSAPRVPRRHDARAF